MDSPVRFTRPLLAFLIGVPLAWAVLLWFHPDVDPNHVYADLRDEVVAYQIVHVGTLVFIGLIGLALYLLVRDLPGRAARISRLAIGPFVLFYAAWESVIGLAIGALVQHGNDAPVRQRPAVADAIQSLGDNVIVGDPGIVGSIGALAWIVAVLAAAIAYRRLGAPARRRRTARGVTRGGLAPAADRTHRARLLRQRGGSPGPCPTCFLATQDGSTGAHTYLAASQLLHSTRSTPASSCAMRTSDSHVGGGLRFRFPCKGAAHDERAS